MNWKDVPSYEGLYQVSDCGQVRALARTIINKNGVPQKYPAKLLKIFWAKHGKCLYGYATLSKNHVVTKYGVHRLVALAFIPNTGNKPCINHIDNNPENNEVTNLEWCTQVENMQHAQKQGRLYNAQSAGGKAGSKVNLDKLLTKLDKVKSTWINSWFVIGKDFSFQRKKKYYVKCRCKCGTESDIEFGRVWRKEITSCATCAKLTKLVKI